jgi:hypothetical protein
MGNSVLLFLIIAAFVVGGIFLYNSNNTNIENINQSTTGEIIRTVPMDGDGKFVVEYKGDFSGNWAVIIVDEVQGDCYFPNGNKVYKSVMTGNGYTSQMTEITGENCKLLGDYTVVLTSGPKDTVKFDEQTVK